MVPRVDDTTRRIIDPAGPEDDGPLLIGAVDRSRLIRPPRTAVMPGPGYPTGLGVRSTGLAIMSRLMMTCVPTADSLHRLAIAIAAATRRQLPNPSNRRMPRRIHADNPDRRFIDIQAIKHD
jgi:hypothetical protein